MSIKAPKKLGKVLRGHKTSKVAREIQNINEFHQKWVLSMLLLIIKTRRRTNTQAAF
jgi:hypothetical protein